MKNKKLVKYVLFLLIGLVLTACGGVEFSYFTRINPDGTVFKRVTAVGDSVDIYSNPFPFDISDGWSVKYDKQIDLKTEKVKYVVIAEKTFSSVDESSKDFFRQNDTVYNKPNVLISYENRFRWFFTFHTYTEVFKKRFPFNTRSIDDYLNDAEYLYAFGGDSSVIAGMTKKEVEEFEDSLGKNFWKFYLRSFVDEYVNLLKSYASKNAKVLTSEQQDTIKAFLLGFDKGMFEFENFKKLSGKADSLLNVNWISSAFESEDFKLFRKLQDSDSFFINEDKVAVELEVPGLVYETNAARIEGHIVKWYFQGSAYQFKDYSISVKYRTMNVWVFVVSGLFIVLIVFRLIRYNKR